MSDQLFTTGKLADADLVQKIAAALRPLIDVQIVDVKERALLVRGGEGFKDEFMIGIRRVKT